MRSRGGVLGAAADPGPGRHRLQQIGLRGALPPQPLDVVADRRAIKQIRCSNLISNSPKFLPGRRPGQRVGAGARTARLEIIVADTGVGIAPADLERLGRPYEQAGGADQRAQGTGLGLSLVRAFAELHGGTMVIKSVLGDGTVVTVRLPVLDREVKTEPPPAAEPAELPEPAEPRRAAVGDNVIAFNPRL